MKQSFEIVQVENGWVVYEGVHFSNSMMDKRKMWVAPTLDDVDAILKHATELKRVEQMVNGL